MVWLANNEKAAQLRLLFVCFSSEIENIQNSFNGFTSVPSGGAGQLYSCRSVHPFLRLVSRSRGEKEVLP